MLKLTKSPDVLVAKINKSNDKIAQFGDSSNIKKLARKSRKLKE